jgi:hypothetical protein
MATSLELKDILGTCTIAFKQRVANLITFGNKGRLLFARQVNVYDYVNEDLESEDLADSEGERVLTKNLNITEYTSAVFTTDDETLETQLKQAMNYSPSKVILFEYSGNLADYKEELDKLKFDWIFTTNEDDQDTVAAYAKENKIFGLVYNLQADSKYVCSVNNPSAVLTNGEKINGIGLLPLVGGLCAGCPYDMSITAYVLSELESVEMPENIIEGQITLYNEEEGVRVASPVNTLTTTSTNNTEDMKSITIMEGIKRLDTDVKYAFRTGYKGKYKNKYDNQALFISACHGYIEELLKNNILDDEYDNQVDINVDRLRELWIASGKDEAEINSMSDLEIKKLSYKKKVALTFDVKFLDAIEECEIDVEMY